VVKVIDSVMRRYESEHERVLGVLRTARRRWSWFDHLALAHERYQERRGDRMAAALTFFGFLSFFPLVALAYAALGYAVWFSDQARQSLIDAINSWLPGVSEELQVDRIAQARVGAGAIGLVGLLFGGLGWVSNLRASLREMWLNDPKGGNFFLKKLGDVGLLLFLGSVLILSVGASTLAAAASSRVLSALGLTGVPGADLGLRLLSVLVAMAFDTCVFLVLFARLSGTKARWRSLLGGAVLGAFGLEVLKQAATYLIRHTTSNPVYASFAVLVGVLIWMNLVSRFLLFTAAWTATRAAVRTADTET
jgi:inner membrane protein YhjD